MLSLLGLLACTVTLEEAEDAAAAAWCDLSQGCGWTDPGEVEWGRCHDGMLTRVDLHWGDSACEGRLDDGALRTCTYTIGQLECDAVPAPVFEEVPECALSRVCPSGT